MIFEQIFPFLLLLAIPTMLWWEFRGSNNGSVNFSDLTTVRQINTLQRPLDFFKCHFNLICRSLFVFFAVLALANPSIRAKIKPHMDEGIDIMLVIDTSGSMRALDLTIDGEAAERLDVVKHVLKQFITARPNDRIGLVMFGDAAFTQAPLTSDHGVLIDLLDSVTIGVIGENTAIGDAIGVAAQRLVAVEKTKLMILLTDGENTAGSLDPMNAAEAAAKLGVNIYTIGVGREGQVPIMGRGFFGQQSLQYVDSNIDEVLLQNIAKVSGATFFRAHDTDSLLKIYDKIDRLEKTKVAQLRVERPLVVHAGLMSLAMGCLLIELLFSFSKWRRIP